VFSCFDEENWDNVEPIEGEVNIATFHGGVNGSTTDIDWNIDGDVDIEFFDKFEFSFLVTFTSFNIWIKKKELHIQDQQFNKITVRILARDFFTGRSMIRTHISLPFMKYHLVGRL